ncbi:MAG: undecaprenyl-diphosphate phosphatase, partial [Lachnospiraceae bacterium]|nr:undecaprenyl-diphosphate phosphatase [Lachnospiraceae bacterium]
MSYLQAIIMGLVQGLAEFLPVSSSGHLVLSKFILGADLGTSAFFEILLHVGT